MQCIDFKRLCKPFKYQLNDPFNFRGYERLRSPSSLGGMFGWFRGLHDRGEGILKDHTVVNGRNVIDSGGDAIFGDGQGVISEVQSCKERHGWRRGFGW